MVLSNVSSLLVGASEDFLQRRVMWEGLGLRVPILCLKMLLSGTAGGGQAHHGGDGVEDAHFPVRWPSSQRSMQGKATGTSAQLLTSGPSSKGTPGVDQGASNGWRGCSWHGLRQDLVSWTVPCEAL